MPPPPESPVVPERLDPAEVASLARRSLANPILRAVLETAEGHVLVLNEARQILACNAELLEALDPPEAAAHVGERMGEAFGCVHAGEAPGGCGTGPACGRCGAALAIIEAQTRGLTAGGECSLNLRRAGRLAAVDLQVKVSTLSLGCHPLTVVVLQDISSRKRLDVLESIFLHDLSNALQSLIGWSERVADGAADPRRAGRRIVELCQRLRQEVQQQRILHDAEQGVLVPRLERVDLGALLEDLRDLFLLEGERQGPRLVVALACPGAALQTDRELLLRVLQNMVGNALEATPVEGTVQVRAEVDRTRASLSVVNPGLVPPEVAARIFHRGVSTKGPGRGLGTYGMKLLAEDYLGGRLDFSSTAEAGTRFVLHLPLG